MQNNLLCSIQVCNGHRRSDDIVEDYCDSAAAQSHPLFGKDPKAIQLYLYYDEVELCNPLGSSRKKHKLGE